MQGETVRMPYLLASTVPCATAAVADTSLACVSPLGSFAGHGWRLVETTLSPGQPMQSKTVRMTDLHASSFPCATGAVTDPCLRLAVPLVFSL
jgi:hypothetical protein